LASLRFKKGGYKMILNKNIPVYSEQLSENLKRKLAYDIYEVLMNSREALKYAEEIKKDMHKSITIEDILWEVAYYNLENDFYKLEVNTVIKLKRN
jgi:hypothetical protein